MGDFFFVEEEKGIFVWGEVVEKGGIYRGEGRGGVMVEGGY